MKQKEPLFERLFPWIFFLPILMPKIQFGAGKQYIWPLEAMIVVVGLMFALRCGLRIRAPQQIVLPLGFWIATGIVALGSVCAGWNALLPGDVMRWLKYLLYTSEIVIFYAYVRRELSTVSPLEIEGRIVTALLTVGIVLGIMMLGQILFALATKPLPMVSDLIWMYNPDYRAIPYSGRCISLSDISSGIGLTMGGSHNATGDFYSLVFLLTLQRRVPIAPLWRIIGAVISIMAILFSFSRTGLVVLALGGLLYAVLGKRWILIGLVALLSTILIASFWDVLIRYTIFARLDYLVNNGMDSSANNRLGIVASVIPNLFSRPHFFLFGGGFGQATFDFFFNRPGAITESSLLSIFLWGGPFFACLFVLFWILVGITALRTRSDLGKAFFAFLVAFIAPNVLGGGDILMDMNMAYLHPLAGLFLALHYGAARIVVPA